MTELEQKRISVLSKSSFLSPVGRRGEEKCNSSTIPEPIIRAGAGEVLMLGPKEDSLTITFYNESLKRQFKYHPLK